MLLGWNGEAAAVSLGSAVLTLNLLCGRFFVEHRVGYAALGQFCP